MPLVTPSTRKLAVVCPKKTNTVYFGIWIYMYNVGVKVYVSEHSIYIYAQYLTACEASTYWSKRESGLRGRAARRNQVLNAVTKWGQSSTFRVEKLRHRCSNSWASDMGNVEMIRKNVSSSSRYNDLLLGEIGETLSLHTTKTGSQSSTSFLLTWTYQKSKRQYAAIN